MNPYGRPKVADKAKVINVSLYTRHIDFFKKSGGSKYLQNLLDREMRKNAEGVETEDNAGHNLEKPQESAKNSALDSVLIHKLKGLSQNFTR